MWMQPWLWCSMSGTALVIRREKIWSCFFQRKNGTEFYLWRVMCVFSLPLNNSCARLTYMDVVSDPQTSVLTHLPGVWWHKVNYRNSRAWHQCELLNLGITWGCISLYWLAEQFTLSWPMLLSWFTPAPSREGKNGSSEQERLETKLFIHFMAWEKLFLGHGPKITLISVSRTVQCGGSALSWLFSRGIVPSSGILKWILSAAPEHQ